MKEHRLLWWLLTIAVIIVLPLSFFLLPGGAFVAPNDPTPDLELGGRVISFSKHSATAPLQPGMEKKAAADELVEEANTAEHSADEPSMDDVIKDFYARHPNLPEKPYSISATGLGKDLCEIFLAVLREDESAATFTKLLRSSNREGRVLAMHALADAEGLLLQVGYPALVNLWVGLGQEDVELVVQSAVEALLRDTEDGAASNIPLLLGTMGDRARPALPHLVWASNNHPSADMRTWCMNTAWMIAPEAPESRDVILRHLVDPDGGTRTQALQALAIRSLASVIGSGRPTEEEVLEHHDRLREGDAQKSKEAA